MNIEDECKLIQKYQLNVSKAIIKKIKKIPTIQIMKSRNHGQSHCNYYEPHVPHTYEVYRNNYHVKVLCLGENGDGIEIKVFLHMEGKADSLDRFVVVIKHTKPQ